MKWIMDILKNTRWGKPAPEKHEKVDPFKEQIKPTNVIQFNRISPLVVENNHSHRRTKSQMKHWDKWKQRRR